MREPNGDLVHDFGILREEIPKQAKKLKDREREVALMTSGLTERPLDRDFVEIQKVKLETQRRTLEMARMIESEFAGRIENASKTP